MEWVLMMFVEGVVGVVVTGVVTRVVLVWF